MRPILVLLLTITLSTVFGQDGSAAQERDPAPAATPLRSGLPDAAQEALEQGREAMQEALETYTANYPDQSLWQEAFRHGRRAQELAPGHPAPLRFLAEAYSRANWYGPAWNAWREYLDQGHVLDAEATPLFTEVGSQLGYTFYEQGDLDEAAEVYSQIIDAVPFDLQAHAWMGRILIETGRPEQAISYWQTVTDRNPDDERARYFLELAREQARWGTRAVNAFREGVALYEEGNLERARERFARATAFNSNYPEAWAWLGRVAFESDDYTDAQTYYRRAVDLQPSNRTYTYFLEESQRRLAAMAEGEPADGAIEQNAGGGPGEATDEDDNRARPGLGDSRTPPAADDGGQGAD